MSSTKIPIVCVHGLWLHAESWNKWMQFFRENGYDPHAASWPGDAETTAATRRNATAVAGYGVTEIADHIAEQIKQLAQKSILIGHSFGGLLVQNLLGRDLAAAGIAIDPASPKGVKELPLSALKSAFPVLSNPFNSRPAAADRRRGGSDRTNGDDQEHAQPVSQEVESCDRIQGVRRPRTLPGSRQRLAGTRRILPVLAAGQGVFIEQQRSYASC